VKEISVFEWEGNYRVETANQEGYAPRVKERDLRNHDEILLEAPFETTDEVALILKETMEEAGIEDIQIGLEE